MLVAALAPEAESAAGIAKVKMPYRESLQAPEERLEERLEELPVSWGVNAHRTGNDHH